MASAELVSGRVLAALTGRPACGPSYGTGGQPDSAVNNSIRLASLWAA